jgi:competence protein ComEC
MLAGVLAGACSGIAAWPLAWFLPPLVLASALCWWRRGADAPSARRDPDARLHRLRAAVRAGVLALTLAGYAIAGAALAAHDRERALHPALRVMLDAAFGGFALETMGPEGAHPPLPVRFTLSEDAAFTGDVVSLRASVDAVLIDGRWRDAHGDRVRLTVGGAEAVGRRPRWRAGRTIEAPVTFRRPARYLDEGVPDFERDLALDGTALLGSIKSGLLVRVLRQGSRLEEWTADVRAYVRRTLTRCIAPRDPVAAAIAIAVLIGDRTGLPDEVRDRLQGAGTYHVIAISGGNIAVVAALVLVMLRGAGAPGRVAALLTILVLVIYAAIVTTGPSVWRATSTAIVYLAARVIDQRTPAWHALAVTAALMLAAVPLDVRDAGFLLTFGATGTLLVVAALVRVDPDARGLAAPGARREPVGARWWWRWIAVPLIASAAVDLALMPVSAGVFSRVTAAGLVLNLVAVPMMALVQLAGTALVPVGGAAAAGDVLGWIACVAASTIVGSARLVDVVPWLSARVPPPAAFVVAAYYIGVAGLIARPRLVRGLSAMVVAASGAVIVAGGPASIPAPSVDASARLLFTVFDVGQAEAMLLQVPGAGPLLVDAGGAPFGSAGFDIGRRVLEPALWARGVASLEALLVTHGDPDHLGGAASLVRDFGPRHVWTGVPVPRYEPLRELLDAAAAAGARSRELRAGETLRWGDARVRILHPPAPDWERQRVRNDDSVVLELVYRDAAILLTGDVSAQIEREITPRLTPAPLRILKVAHHGSRTSTSRELLAAWHPQIAVISCGRGNRFGHPTPETLARLAEAGVRVLRTDRDGQITIESDGRTARVRTFTARP